MFTATEENPVQMLSYKPSHLSYLLSPDADHSKWGQLTFMVNLPSSPKLTH